MAKKTVTRKFHDRHDSAGGHGEPKNAEQKVSQFICDVVLPNWVSILLAALIAVAVVIGFHNWSQAQREKRAEMLAEVSAAATVGELRALAEKYSGKPAGLIATFAAAKQLYTERQYVEAENAFATFAKDHPKTQLAVDALIGWAYSLEARGKSANAEKVFLDAAGNPNAAAEQRAEALCGAGRNALAQGEKQFATARRHYENAMAAVDTGLYRQRARDALQRIELTSPEEDIQPEEPDTQADG